MFTRNINIHNNALRIIVAPLDWGLGHATRCIPIIRALQRADVQVFIAADGACAALLKKEFPKIFFLPLEGYHIRYSKNKRWFKWKLISQFLRVRSKIRNEHRWLKLIVEEFKIDAVISDNRFGFYDQKIPSVFITHQLNIQAGNQIVEKLARTVNYSYIQKFSECWIPDEKENGYAGVLSHPEHLPKTTIKYAGILSRFESVVEDKKYDFLFLISGPEPQRTIFENKITELINEHSFKIAIVRGIPLPENVLKSDHADVFDHLSATELNKMIAASETIICRSGYSTVMDLITLGKQAILIPTPGQSEQEYLANYLNERKLFKTISQEKMTKEIFECTPYPLQQKQNSVDEFINNWLSGLRKRNKISV